MLTQTKKFANRLLAMAAMLVMLVGPTTQTHAAPAYARYLGQTFDKCSQPVVNIMGRLNVRKGQRGQLYVGTNRFWWYCGDSREWTTCPRGTNLVTIYRRPTGRDIIWSCYRA